MIHSLPSPLPSADRVLLHLAARVVPGPERPDWLRYWQAELWHRHHPRVGGLDSAADLYPGVMRDAVWLRTESWRLALTGTASLCIFILATLLLCVLVPLTAILGGAHELALFATQNLWRFLCEAVLVTLVGFATASRTVEHTSRTAPLSLLRAQVFQVAKVVLVLMTTFVLSTDVTAPIHAAHPFTAEIIQPQLFVFLALLGLRWNFQDQDNRCKHCLRALAMPSRVGRPTWNFLDFNGTEMSCRDGHGLLSIPEMETSWCRSSRWIAG